MKTIQFAAIMLLTLWQPAEAMEIGRAGNDAGGYIVFTDEVCKEDRERRYFFSYTRSGHAIGGCWVAIGQELFARFSDGDMRVYPIDALELSEEFKRAVDRRARGEAM